MSGNKSDFNLQVDSHVGHKLRELRNLYKKTQNDIGQLLGVSYQQVQKYERGTTRLGIHNIQILAKTFNLTPDYFFRGLANPTSEKSIVAQNAMIPQKELLLMIELFTQISDAELRASIIRKTQELVDSQGTD